MFYISSQMSLSDLKKGGEWYEVAQELKSVAKQTGMFVAVKPFDQHQGPYALLSNGDKIWMEENGFYILEIEDDNFEVRRGHKLTKEQIKNFYKSNAERFIESIEG